MLDRVVTTTRITEQLGVSSFTVKVQLKGEECGNVIAINLIPLVYTLIIVKHLLVT